MDEIELAKQAINGNEAAQLQLLNLYKEPMYRVAYSYMQNEHDANDALQEMTYQCLKNIHKVQTPQYFKTWLVRVVINTCLMMKRQQKRIIVTNDLLQQPQHMTELFELNDVISQLPIEQQELVHLKYFRDLKNSEIATLQNIPEGTVKSRLHKTLKKLRHLLGEGGLS
ncbi:sigma-70 family RNA polymerase sigma factor [Bacillus sp. FJAT-29790]|uniref:sigma-70 family RNA polymerase sigma factor n=1 Tax=Bacillus sp. FJAT-29790 TaxID=1895002 RepID=UPI001C210CB2|nr:sigma-70 family RNA polymerase sigma factor [Bacillus sp. FJAT-29790]MBU8881244.1 sigma-70 family RNA polymerase sigma factor [Bacillus sp. FJAT-29790]